MNLMKGVEFASSLSALEGTIAALNDLEFIKKQRKLLKMAENICQKSLKN